MNVTVNIYINGDKANDVDPDACTDTCICASAPAMADIYSDDLHADAADNDDDEDEDEDDNPCDLDKVQAAVAGRPHAGRIFVDIVINGLRNMDGIDIDMVECDDWYDNEGNVCDITSYGVIFQSDPEPLVVALGDWIVGQTTPGASSCHTPFRFNEVKLVG